MGWARQVRHRLRGHEHGLRIVGDVLLVLAILSTLGLVLTALLSPY